MNEYWNDIKDDEIRIIGHASPANRLAAEESSSAPPKKNRIRGPVIAAAAVLALLAVALILFLPGRRKAKDDSGQEGLFEDAPAETARSAVPQPLGTATDLTFTEKTDTVINDVVLSLYIPHNATPELTIGVPDRTDDSIIFAAQAADIRKDNRKILGAFVLKGQPVAWGLSKKGFCAIIDGKITVGVSENTPLFEEATEKEGYFFRQYPLVDHGTLVENEPKNKTMRKALCTRAGQTFVAFSETDESFHDFAQALVDLGVDDAIYLVGSHSSFGWYMDADGEKTLFAPDVHRGLYRNENYIIWR